MNANAYFQLKTKDDGLYLILYPPAEGGEKLVYSEICQYLDDSYIGFYDSDELVEALKYQLETTEVKLNDEMIEPVDEVATASVCDDKMSAYARFYSPSEGGAPLSKSDIICALSAAGVSHGIDEGRIAEWMGDRVYCTDILVAEGIPPQESEDAVIEYLFETEDVFRPTIEDDGSVNFHELNLLNDVSAGDELAVLTPEVRGIFGMNVIGTELPSRNPAKKAIKSGKNTVLSEDRCTLTAATGGYVEIENDRIVVHSVYSITGNVGTATGDVDFDGIVRISGDVQTGYSVKASVDIFVQGVVEGSNVEAGRDIVIANGVHGTAKARISAGGDITVNFIQESKVSAGGSVHAGSILYSIVTANDSIFVSSRRGLVKGGELRAASLISVKTVGSARAGANTKLAVGADIEDLELFHKLEATIDGMREEQSKLHQIQVFLKRKVAKKEPLRADHRRLIKLLPAQIGSLGDEIEKQLKRHSKLKARLDNSDKGKIVVEGTVYEGATIMISNETYHVLDDLAQCQFVKAGAEIVIESL